MKTQFILMAVFIGSLHTLCAQTQITGRVMDTNDQRIVGATIRGSDGKLLAITDSLGIFTFKKPADNLIVASHLAFIEQELTIDLDRKVPWVIVMESNSNVMDEVDVSTGFQRIPKERATGAFSFIDNETFNEQVGGDVLSRLPAVANGLSVDHLSQENDLGIRIRGQSTFSSGAMRDPLIILDNFPFEGDFNNINPNDVENITLLKDAAASSIWGARAANGVIVITTKRAKRNQPARIDFNSNVTVQNKPDLAYYDLMSSAEFIEVERFLFGNSYRFSDTVSLSRPAFSPVYELLFRQRAGELTESQANALITALSRTDIRDEFSKHTYEAALQQQYALSIQGGSDHVTWYFSSGYDRNKNELSAINDRLTLNFRNTYSPVRNLRLEAGIMYVQSKSVSGKTGFSNGDMFPYTSFADESGHALTADNRILQTYRQLFVDTLGAGQLLDWKYYPLTNDDFQNNQSSQSHALLNFNVNYKPLDWLGLDIKYQYGRQTSTSRFLRTEENYFTRDLINRFSQYDVSGAVIHNVPRGSILDKTSGLLQSHNLRGQIDVEKQWVRHGINIVAGMEASHRNDANNTHRTFGYNPETLTFGQVNYLMQYRHFVQQYNTLIPRNHNFNDQTRRFISTFLNGAYTLDAKYTFSISGRRDASNLFGVNVNDRWNLLWSTGLSWEVSKERFYGFSVLPYLRLRTTYGFSGNTDLNRSAVTTVFYSGTSSYSNEPSAYVAQNANPELRWEKTRMMNIALDFKFNDNWLSGSFDFFLKHGTDLLGPDPVDYTTGIFGIVTRNISEIKGRGFDLQLTSTNVANGRLHWSTNLNLSYYDDKVARYYQQNLTPSRYVTLNIGTPTNIEGERMYAMYSYRWAGLDPETGDPLLYLNGEPSKDYAALRGTGTQMEDLVNHGSAIPLIFGALGNNIRYRSLGISFNLMFNLNYHVRTNALQYDLLYQGNPGFSEWSHRWQKPGDELETNVPSMVYPVNTQRETTYASAELKVQRGDHVRLQYVNFHYDFVTKGLRGSKIRSLRVYANLANIGVLWKRGTYHHDPTYGYGNMPPATTYSLGLKTSF